MRACAEWGLAGLLALRGQVAVLVVVDVLSFSTAVDVAVGRGAMILPFLSGDPAVAQAEAARQGATAAVRRGQPGFSLSLASLQAAPPGLRLLLPSPNGSRLSLAGGGVPVLAGCLRNAAAVARAALRLAARSAWCRPGSIGRTAACARPSRTCWAPERSCSTWACRPARRRVWRATPSAPPGRRWRRWSAPDGPGRG